MLPFRRFYSTVGVPCLTRFHLRAPKSVEMEYSNGDAFKLSAEFLGVHNPAADGRLRTIGGEKVISGRRHVGIMSAEPVGNYGDLRPGNGPTPKIGDTVVVDWDGYTIGYYGRIFEARNKTKGGSFEGDEKEFFKFKVGSQEVIPAFEEAVAGMALGGIRRIIVPPELGYLENDYNKSSPKPTTFSVFDK